MKTSNFLSVLVFCAPISQLCVSPLRTVMAFRWFKKSDLVAAVIVFGFMAVLFALAAVFGDSLGGRMTDSGRGIQKSDPEYAEKVWRWRAGMFVGSLFCV